MTFARDLLFEQELYDNDEAELLFEDDNYCIFFPKTEKAARYFQSGTNIRYSWTIVGNVTRYLLYTKSNIILDKKSGQRWVFVDGFIEDENRHYVNISEFKKYHNIIIDFYIKHNRSIVFFGQLLTKVPRAFKKAVLNLWPGRCHKLYNNLSNTQKKRILRKKGNGWLLNKLYKNPSYIIQKLAIKHDGYAILQVEEQTEELQWLAFSETPSSLMHIKNPVIEMKMIHWVMKNAGYKL